jgi:hypothetical protein
MTHHPDQTVYITKALIDLAVANGLKHINHCQYKDRNGNDLTQTELGYISTECFNYKLKYGELVEDVKEITAELESLKGEKKRLVTQNKEISTKTLFKLSVILRDNISDKEKIIQIRRYLNI